MSTQTNPANVVGSAVKTPIEVPLKTEPDPAALSAGIRSIMGGEEAPGQFTQADKVTSAAEADGESAEDGAGALVASSNALALDEETGLVERQSIEARLPVQLDVGIPIRDFRVKNLLALESGSLIESQWVPGEDVPVVSGEVQVAWSEFEVVDSQLAVRLTRLA